MSQCKTTDIVVRTAVSEKPMMQTCQSDDGSEYFRIAWRCRGARIRTLDYMVFCEDGLWRVDTELSANNLAKNYSSQEAVIKKIARLAELRNNLSQCDFHAVTSNV